MEHLKVVCTSLVFGAVALAVVPVAHGQVSVVTQDSPSRSEIQRTLVRIGAERAAIGVSIRDVEEDDPSSEGAVITEVGEGSPADEAGLLSGDIIVEFDGERVRSAQQLTRLVQETPAGRTVNGMVMRDGERVELEVTPTEAEGPFQRVGPNLTFRMPAVPAFDWTSRNGGDLTAFYGNAGRSTALLGIRLQELGPQLAEHFGVETGVLVTRVTEDSPASEAGLVAGDVITTIYGRVVDDVRDVQRRVRRADPGEDITLGVVRDKEEITVQVPLAQDSGPQRFRIERPGNRI